MQNSDPTKEHVDINSLASTKKGGWAAFENLFRKFQNIGYVLFLLPIAMIYVFCIACSLTPGLWLLQWVSEQVAAESLLYKSFAYGLSLGIGFVGFIVVLIFVVPLCNLPFLPFVKKYRGPWFSVESLPWFYHNALTYLVRYTILDFITPSPLNILFFRMMGMKVGKGTMINTSNVSDPCLIILDDYVTIGGSAFILAHYGMKGFLIIDKLHIKKGAIIGLGAKVFGGVTIDEKATVLPNSAVLPKTHIKAGTKFGTLAGVID